MAVEYTLKHPIKVSGNVIKKLLVQEPNFDQVIENGLPSDASDPKVAMAILRKYLTRCTGLTDADVGELKVSDVIPLISIVAGFFNESEQ